MEVEAKILSWEAATDAPVITGRYAVNVNGAEWITTPFTINIQDQVDSIAKDMLSSIHNRI